MRNPRLADLAYADGWLLCIDNAAACGDRKGVSVFLVAYGDALSRAFTCDPTK